YLQALQKCADGGVEPQYIPNPAPDITLEHILPKDAGIGWTHFSVDEKKLFVYRLGNQTLLQNTVNGKIGNQP
ncbi:MAG TPA: HNH endonuclease family protein, partial [Candidatus Angelobacter sp.]|nr:HNH endonuclease family protein [Candidatus Angelobacter sp.]